MAGSEGSIAVQSPPPKPETSANTVAFTKTKIPRRRLTLLGLTICLHVLLWSSICTSIATLYLLGTDAEDGANVPTDILSLLSFLASIVYIAFHTIISLKQKHSTQDISKSLAAKRTSYVAVRLSVTSCVLWLLTCGWDMILVARQPTCLSGGFNLPGWEVGVTCVVGRASIAMSLLALIASCTLFGMLAVVRRPFEAHLFAFKHKTKVQTDPTPFSSQMPSRSASNASGHSMSRASVRPSVRSEPSNADVETLNLDSNSRSSIHSPSPVRSIGLGIYTFGAPQLPFPPSSTPSRRSSIISSSTPPNFYPTASSTHLLPPPRMSSLVTPSGFVPLSIPMSSSAWRAIHPPAPSPLAGIGSRSFSHLPYPTGQPPNFSYLTQHSRSMHSLTRPNRLSSAPVGTASWSSSSGSIDEKRRRSPSTSTTRSATASPSSSSIGVVLTAGGATAAIPTRNPGSKIRNPKTRGKGQGGHIRRASAPDVNLAVGNGRWPKGWRPRLQGQEETLEYPPLAIPASISGESAIDSSKTTSPDEMKEVDFGEELELRLGLVKDAPLRKARSMSLLRRSDSFSSTTAGATAPGIGRSSTLKSARKASPSGKSSKGLTKELLNKPLPKIAAL